MSIIAAWTPPALTLVVVILTAVQWDALLAIGWSPISRNPVQWPSLLLLLEGGWIFSAGLTLTGASIAAFGCILLATSEDRWCRFAAGLVSLSGLGLVFVSLPPMAADSPEAWMGAVHNTAYPLMLALWLAAASLYGRITRGKPAWRNANRFTAIAIPLFLLCFGLQLLPEVAQLARYIVLITPLTWFHLTAQAHLQVLRHPIAGSASIDP